MKCSCGEKAVYFRRYSGQRFCKDCFNEYFEKKVLETVRKHKMVRRGEQIGVAVSGGKDSTVLLHVLNKLSHQFEITLRAILIDEGINEYRESGIHSAQKMCASLGIGLSIVSFSDEIGYELDDIIKEGELKPCTYCGVFRRRLLNQEATRLELDKLATGHNLDDEAQAMMMNYLSGDIERLYRLSGNVEADSFIKRIKPLSKLPEKEVMLYALLNSLNISTDECPYAKDTQRVAVRDFLNKLEIERPGVKFSVVRGGERLVDSCVMERNKLGSCRVCGQPAARDVCRVCELTEEIKIKMRGVS